VIESILPGYYLSLVIMMAVVMIWMITIW